MSNITFDEIMDFYPKHNRAVYDSLKQKCQAGCLVPFVGAGLSVFCGYKSWPDTLKELSTYIFSPNKQEQINTLITNDDLLQAAQVIYDSYHPMIDRLSEIIDYRKIQICNQTVLCSAAAYVLPYLFGTSPVMTTNFDRVLEEVYDKCQKKFSKIVTPYEVDLLAQMRQTNAHGLFKLHGDIGPDTHDITKLVFTKEQYEKAYADDSRLVTELSRWFQNKQLLFLGCSLTMDKTMEVLQFATKKNDSALSHYAILACKTEDMENRINKIADLGISAIYYPDGKHDAVRVLLERLLEETNYPIYEELYRCTKAFSPNLNTTNRFMYNSEFFAFTGREKELDLLGQFCETSKQISWWAVTAPGGMGKSRLVYEFTNAQRTNGWHILWLTRNDYRGLSQIIPPVGRCIVVADDVQDYLPDIGKWLMSVSERPRSEKLRILLLERDGRDLSSAKWMEIMCSDDPDDPTISSSCHCSDFLQLEPLSEDDLKSIMINFALASGKPIAGPDHAQRLLQTLQKIDKGLQRPMYALAITDAWCSGKDPTQWNKDQILDNLVEREVKFYSKRLRSIFGKSPSSSIRSELETIMVRSCTTPFLPLKLITEEDYPKLCKKANNLDLDLHEVLRQIGLVHEVVLSEIVEDADKCVKEQARRFESIELLCPDLVKEYFVLRRAFDKNQHDLLLPDDWENDPVQLSFLLRILLDYPEKLDGEKWFWSSFFTRIPEQDLSTLLYSYFLFGVTVQLPTRANQAVNHLEILCEKHHDCTEVAVAFAKGLFNLAVDQPPAESARTIGRLETLYKNHQNCTEVAVEFARGLFNLANKQPPAERAQTIGALETLYKNHQNCTEVAVEFARGLVNLTANQPPAECAQTIGTLETLYKNHQNCTEIAVTLSNGLVNLAFSLSSESDVQKTLSRSREILDAHPQSKDIQLRYAQTWFNLTLVQNNEADLRSSVTQIVCFLKSYPNAIPDFKVALDVYLSEHPDHTQRYQPLLEL